MKLLDRYIATTVIGSTFLVLFLFFSVQSFVQLLAELQDIGQGHYGIAQALGYVGLQSLTIMYQLFPVAGLVGSLIGLGKLATHSELIVMRAAGVSKASINFAAVKAAIIMLVLVTVCGEMLGPKALAFAEDYKSIALTGQPIATINSGWILDKDNFIFIGRRISDTALADIDRFQINQQQLMLASHAQSARLENGRWFFYGVKQVTLHPQAMSVKNIDRQYWPVSFNARLLGLSNLDPNNQSLHALYSYIQFMHANDLEANQLEFSFYQRLFQPLATIVMICLAIPFVFGPLRSASMGLRILVGIMVGFGFYTLNQFLGSFSMVYQVSPFWAAASPILLFMLIDFLLLWYIR